MNFFISGLLKQAKKKATRPSQKEVDRAQAVMAAAALGNSLGAGGAYLAGRVLGDQLKENHLSLPSVAHGSDIQNVKKHFNDAVQSLVSSHPIPKYVYVVDPPEEATKKELAEIADLGESFIKEHKLRESGIKFNAGNSGKLGDYYNPIKNTVNMNTSSRAVALHEMGHAADYRGSLAKTVGRKIPVALALAAAPAALAYGDSVKERIPGTADDKVIDFLQKNPVTAVLAGYGLSTLYPEARASFSALKHIYKHRGRAEMMKDLKKSLGPAYMTYVAAAAPLAAGTLFAKHVRSSQLLNKKKEEKKPLKKVANSQVSRIAAKRKAALKAFYAGALTAGIPAALTTYYRYGTEGGKVISDLSDELSQRDLRYRYGEHIGNALSKGNKKWRDRLEKRPVVSSLAAGAGAGVLSGLLTAFVMDRMGVKKIAEDVGESKQGDLPLPRTISTIGPRLDAVTVESDRSKFPTFRG